MIGAISVDLRSGANLFTLNNAITIIPALAALVCMGLVRRGQYKLGVIQLNRKSERSKPERGNG